MRYAVGLNVLFIAAGVTLSCRFFHAESLKVENRSDVTVIVMIDTIGRADIPPRESAIIDVGRGLTPSTVHISGDRLPRMRCRWNEVKEHEPLVIDNSGALCTDTSFNSSE